MANKSFVSICVLLLALNLISSSPASANWFGKRGDQDDILGFLLKQTDEQQESFSSAESAMAAIERIITRWRMARKMGIATPTQKIVFGHYNTSPDWDACQRNE